VRTLKILLAIDDTDDLESKATGELASVIEQTIEARGWGKGHGVTRHQLLIHPDIPYTSHNSSMCFPADIYEAFLEDLICYASEFLQNESAAGSDPGLCVAVTERISNPELLIAFGQKVKEVVVTKEEAYTLAKQLDIHLSEHGGTGQGVIGALAGAGLRLSGNDGRFKGTLEINTDSDIVSVGEILSTTYVDEVKSLEGAVLEDEQKIKLVGKVKPVLIEGKCILLVHSIETELTAVDEVRWQNCSKQQLKNY
jgi:hypothetical protein